MASGLLAVAVALAVQVGLAWLAGFTVLPRRPPVLDAASLRWTVPAFSRRFVRGFSAIAALMVVPWIGWMTISPVEGAFGLVASAYPTLWVLAMLVIARRTWSRIEANADGVSLVTGVTHRHWAWTDIRWVDWQRGWIRLSTATGRHVIRIPRSHRAHGLDVAEWLAAAHQRGQHPPEALPDPPEALARLRRADRRRSVGLPGSR